MLPRRRQLLLPALLGAALAASSLAARGETQGDAHALARAHWAYQPLRRPELPGSGHPVDAFVRATLRTNGLSPSPSAPPRELLRRVYFDLIGLPPTPAEVEAFVRECAAEPVPESGSGRPAGAAYVRVVDQLLASPHYGERWARHWLDIVRFTESQGFEYDRPRDYAWPYRDYVVRAFNADMPYDRFMREQVAGDVLEPVTADGIVAASLLVCGPWDQAGSSQANIAQRTVTREDELEDLLGTVGQTFLGLTVNCARCHDHKFDPIPLTDYYRLKSVFDGVKHGDRPVEGSADAKAREDRLTRAKRELEQAQAELGRLEALGVQRALALQAPDRSSEPGPVPFRRWDFTGAAVASPPGQAHDGAVITSGQLQLPRAGAYFQSPPLDRDLREKTLEAWVSLNDLKQGGGAAISLETADGRQFDALVFGERQPRKWMAGSEGFARTRDVEAPEENAAAGTWVHLAAVYSADNRVALYRNGEPYGQPYTAGPLVTFRAGDARVTLGRRHLGGGKPWLTGAIRHAALHDRALDAQEVKAAFRSGGFSVPPEAMLAQLNADERAAREAALAQVAQSTEAVKAAGKPGPLAYAGVRRQPEPTKSSSAATSKRRARLWPPGRCHCSRPFPATWG